MEVRAIDRQTRHALLGNADAGLTGTTKTLLFLCSTCCSSLLLLGLFDRDLFIRIADALALIRLGRTNSTNLGSHLTYALAVSTLDTISVGVGVATVMPAGISN
jgi:hypothetical protein